MLSYGGTSRTLFINIKYLSLRILHLNYRIIWLENTFMIVMIMINPALANLPENQHVSTTSMCLLNTSRVVTASFPGWPVPVLDNPLKKNFFLKANLNIFWNNLMPFLIIWEKIITEWRAALVLPVSCWSRGSHFWRRKVTLLGPSVSCLGGIHCRYLTEKAKIGGEDSHQI